MGMAPISLMPGSRGARSLAVFRRKILRMLMGRKGLGDLHFAAELNGISRAVRAGINLDIAGTKYRSFEKEQAYASIESKKPRFAEIRRARRMRQRATGDLYRRLDQRLLSECVSSMAPIA